MLQNIDIYVCVSHMNTEIKANMIRKTTCLLTEGMSYQFHTVTKGTAAGMLCLEFRGASDKKLLR